MTETSEEKTETASRKKLREGRKRGQVVTVSDAVVCATVAATLLYICASFGGYVERASSFFDEAMFHIDTTDPAEKLRVVGLFADLVARSFTSVLGMAALIAVLCTVTSQGGLIFAFETIKPDFNRLNPVEGFLRMFQKRALITLVVNLIRMAIWTAMALVVFLTVFDGLFDMVEVDLNAAGSMSLRFIVILIVCGFVYLLLVVASDIIVQNRLFADQMRMTKSELKQERKQSFGDPAIARARKAAMRKDAESATGVTGSSFIAKGKNGLVGIYYEHMVTPAPIMTLRVPAARMRDYIVKARKHDVPLVDADDLVDILQRGLAAGDELSDSAAVQPFVRAYALYAQGEHI